MGIGREQSRNAAHICHVLLAGASRVASVRPDGLAKSFQASDRSHGRHYRYHLRRPVAPAPPRKGEPARSRCRRRSRTGSGCARRTPAAMPTPARSCKRKRPRHGVRGGRLPEYRRVLGQEARHLHDHGRHLHPRLRVLQRQDRHARARSIAAEPETRRARRSPSSGLPMSSSPRSTATISPTAAPSILRRPSAPSAPRCPTTTIEILTPDFLRKRGRAGSRRRGKARRVQPQSGNRAVALSHGAARARAISIPSACCSG